MSDQKYTIEQIEAALSPCTCGDMPTVRTDGEEWKYGGADVSCDKCLRWHASGDTVEALSMWELDVDRLRLFHTIAAELVKARIKHPHFAHRITSLPSDAFSQMVETCRVTIRRDIAHDSIDAYPILVCEMFEALEAYTEGRLDDALVELAQAGAVIVRMMEMVRREMKTKAFEAARANAMRGGR